MTNVQGFVPFCFELKRITFLPLSGIYFLRGQDYAPETPWNGRNPGDNFISPSPPSNTTSGKAIKACLRIS